MPGGAANLTFLYQDVRLLERIGKAAEDGFGALEYVSPYDRDKLELAATSEP